MQDAPEWKFTDEAIERIQGLIDEHVDDDRAEVIGLRDRIEDLERQVHSQRESTPTPADRADSLLKHLASTGVIKSYRHIDGNKHFDQIFKDICELFIQYDKARK